MVKLDIRDFKYLSHSTPFQTTIDDPEILAGNKPGTLSIDFRQITAADATGDSKYVVGGRAYFEASIFGVGLSSFTYKGFFDQDGYVEPKSSVGKLKEIAVWLVIGFVVLVIAVVLVVYFFCCKKKEKKSKVE